MIVPSLAVGSSIPILLLASRHHMCWQCCFLSSCFSSLPWEAAWCNVWGGREGTGGGKAAITSSLMALMVVSIINIKHHKWASIHGVDHHFAGTKDLKMELQPTFNRHSLWSIHAVTTIYNEDVTAESMIYIVKMGCYLQLWPQLNGDTSSWFLGLSFQIWLILHIVWVIKFEPPTSALSKRGND